MNETSEAIERPALAWLWGARIQRVDGPKPGLFALSLFAERRRVVLLLAVGMEARGVGAAEDRPRGEGASSFVQRLRRSLDNARITRAEWLTGGKGPGRATALRIYAARGELETTFVADFARKGPGLLWLGGEGRIAGASDVKAMRTRGLRFGEPFAAAEDGGIAIPGDHDALVQAAATWTGAGTATRLEALRGSLGATLRAQLKRAERKASAIEGDLARAAEAPMLRHQASLILCHLSDIPRGAVRVELLDPSADPEATIAVNLNPALGAKENAQRMFERARKVERGAGIATQRLAETRDELDRLRALATDLGACTDEDALAGVADRLGIATSQHHEGAKKKRAKPETHIAYHTFEGTGGARILVGKNALDNDTLTLTVARPRDHFLHVRGHHGSHVIVPLERGAELSAELLIDAAHLAVHFSEVRGEATAEVQHTERRYVRKPKGAARGAVILDREKVLHLRVEPGRLARLLGR